MPSLPGPWPTVEADRTGEPVIRCGSKPGVAAAEAEPDREDRVASSRAEVRSASGHVRLDTGWRGLLHVRHVLEVVATLLGAGSPPEVVERERGIPALGEAQGELLVEAVEAADVREDDDADARGLLRRCHEMRRTVPVERLENEIVVRDRSAGEGLDRWRGVEVEAHAPDPTRRPRDARGRRRSSTSRQMRG